MGWGKESASETETVPVMAWGLETGWVWEMERDSALVLASGWAPASHPGKERELGSAGET
jgi:hypothetical protein